MKSIQLFLVVVFIALLVAGCADPRTSPPIMSEPAYTETKTLWDDIVSGGEARGATFAIDRDILSAKLTIAGFITPDSSILWYEALLNDSIPTKEDEIEYFDGTLAKLGPDSLWSPEDSAIGVPLQDSLRWATDARAAMGERLYSLIVIIDNRFVLSIWFDEDAVDSTALYPDAVYTHPDTLAGQHFYSSPSDTDSVSVSGSYIITKGRSFQLDLGGFEVADPDPIGFAVEINWLLRLTPGSHTIRARMKGDGSKITGTIVLVYSEGEI